MGQPRAHSIREEELLLTTPSTPREEYPPDHGEASDDKTVNELHGLLSGHASSPRKTTTKFLIEEESRETSQSSRLRKWIISVALFFIFILFSSFFLRPFLSRPGWFASEAERNRDPARILSNGTHEYKETVLLVSIDGLRADYLDRGLTPHLLEISRQGLRAKWMKPVFPTITFPNHWSLMTGLYSESHGIVANNFWDPETNSDFHYSDPKRSWNASWWKGEPIWATAEKAGLRTANLMWPGPPITHDGIAPTHFVEFKDKVPTRSKLDQIMEWLELPIEARPQLIAAYEPSLDQAGHSGGPDSEIVQDTLVYIDEFARDLHQEIRLRNLTHIVDIIFVSDHGMADTSNTRLVYLDDILGVDGVKAIEHEDGWPAVGLRFVAGTNESQMLSLLQAASDKTPWAFDVYTRETMPPRYHFSQSERIAPIYLVPKLGWAITNHHEHEVLMEGDYQPKGNHGFDNDEPSMFAMFVADGPFTGVVKRSAVPAWRRWLSSSRSAHDPYVIDGFSNLEVYGLIAKLLGIEEFAAPNNGTMQFWDKYL